MVIDTAATATTATERFPSLRQPVPESAEKIKLHTFGFHCQGIVPKTIVQLNNPCSARSRAVLLHQPETTASKDYPLQNIYNCHRITVLKIEGNSGCTNNNNN